MTRRVLKSIGAHGLHATGADRVLGALSGRSRQPLILCYHRVVEDVRAHPQAAPAMLVSVATLERQLDWVGRRYRFAGLDEVARAIESGSPRRGGRPLAAVTFDDGYADVYHHGFPLLARKGIPPAVFLTTGLVGTDGLHAHDELFRLLLRAAGRLGAEGLESLLREAGAAPGWRPSQAPLAGRPLVELTERLLTDSSASEVDDLIERLEAALAAGPEGGAAPAGVAPPELAPMSWAMVRELHAAGATVGSHTRSHRMLPNEDEPDVLTELTLSKRTIEEHVGAEVHHLAYPGGQYCPRTVAAAEAAGYRYAYTTCHHGFRDRPLLAIQRRTFWERSSAGVSRPFSPAIAACQVEGILDLVRPCRSDHRPRRRSGAPRRPTLGEATP